jgi:hypothetical protein
MPNGAFFRLAVEIAEELDVFGVRERVALLDEFGERVADPGNDHAPALDAAEAVGAVFERVQLEQGVDVEGLGGLTRPVTLTVQGRVGRHACVLGGVGFVGAELVEVVVVGDVLEAGEVFAGGGEGLLTVWSLVSAWTAPDGARISLTRSAPRATAPVAAAAAMKLRRFIHFSFGVISEEGMLEPESGRICGSAWKPRKAGNREQGIAGGS